VIISVSICEDKELSKETEKKLEEFWKKHRELFGE